MQHTGETLHEYWERFNKLCATCPHHQISDQQRSIDGQDTSSSKILDLQHGKQHVAIWSQRVELIPAEARKPANRVDITGETAYCWTTSIPTAAKVCGICTSVEHPTNMCPILQETKLDQPENVGAIGGFQYGKQPNQTWPIDNQ
ncbi:hypothetical protein CR513_18118, partial [Mucuna pruriens]